MHNFCLFVFYSKLIIFSIPWNPQSHQCRPKLIHTQSIASAIHCCVRMALCGAESHQWAQCDSTSVGRDPVHSREERRVVLQLWIVLHVLFFCETVSPCGCASTHWLACIMLEIHLVNNYQLHPFIEIFKFVLLLFVWFLVPTQFCVV